MTNDNDKIPSPEEDPKVATVSDFPEKIPNELPHHSWFIGKHAFIERNATLLLILSFLVVTIGGIVEIVPLFYISNVIEKVEGMRPYTPLELAGRNIYMREGCYLCHSQMIRPMRDEVERYGHYSLAAESMYDHPFQWGSKRTGPDLARVGGRYSDDWHRDHMRDPRSLVPESIMPAYPWLEQRHLDYRTIEGDLAALRVTGVPYTDEMITAAANDLRAQANPDSDGVDGLLERYPGAQVRNFDRLQPITELDALVAYLQMLGTLVDFSTFEVDEAR
ncbi:cytochrome-c oxidase, cbb3-type subunit II [Oceanicella sp. SM1341]|uniref:cytochrome-c oxidase, cbb3-type subunit II n=1 Tax=Oceanicella sp. SM1341 TaxID=1548889 RepID=UPI000E48669D|nr:cytochrome-c oxidase, cbb3-type subunit II [Oceanicella sp. SM1341]